MRAVQRDVSQDPSVVCAKLCAVDRLYCRARCHAGRLLAANGNSSAARFPSLLHGTSCASTAEKLDLQTAAVARNNLYHAERVLYAMQNMLAAMAEAASEPIPTPLSAGGFPAATRGPLDVSEPIAVQPLPVHVGGAKEFELDEHPAYVGFGGSVAFRNQ
jgi:hypothetical protein